jgi:hypothetical protein
METLKLRRIQEPSRIESLLQAYVLRARVLPGDAYPVRDPRELPSTLRAIVARAEEHGEVWSCWTRGSKVWLFTCHMPLSASRERGAPVLEVHQYGEDAELRDSGIWRYDPLGTWSRCAD